LRNSSISCRLISYSTSTQGSTKPKLQPSHGSVAHKLTFSHSDDESYTLRLSSKFLTCLSLNVAPIFSNVASLPCDVLDKSF